MTADWDARYAETGWAFGTEPNDFLREQAHHLPTHGRVLCLAEGEGRNAVWLAQQGHRVTGVDTAAVGLAKAHALAAERGVTIETVVADLATFDPGSDASGFQSPPSTACDWVAPLARPSQIQRRSSSALTGPYSLPSAPRMVNIIWTYLLWKAAFTSGFIRITSAQMPMGNPTRQQGETQGTMATMVAVMAKL